MTVLKAEKQLFAALAAGRAVAIAKDATGNVVEVPQREWPYLQIFQEQERDVLKHDALDRVATFSEIKLQRDDLKKVWEEYLVEAYMIEPLMRTGTAGYVPLSAAFHWIMTEAGRKVRHLEDSELWKASVERLLPLISTNEVQIIGTPISGGTPEVIDGHIFAGILVSEAARDSFEMITGDNPWISCIPYIDEQHWNNGFNDQLHLQKSGLASWTHLQVRKVDVLRELSPLMDRVITAQSFDDLPKMQSRIREVAKQLWPSGKTPPRIKERDQAIRTQFEKSPPSERTIRRALKDWP